MKLGISLSVGNLPLEPQVDAWLDAIDSLGHTGFIVLATHVMDPLGRSASLNVKCNYSGRVFVSIAKQGTFTQAYLEGMRTSLKHSADIVISVDADGAHTPEDLCFIVEPFVNAEFNAVMGSRKCLHSINTYPFLRRLISWIGTFLSNLLLKPSWSSCLSDYTSGYEAVRAHVLRKLFLLRPPVSWISVIHGPYHLQNTELRMYLQQMGTVIHEVPIKYGLAKKGKNLKLKYLLKAFCGYLKLISRRADLRGQ